MKKKILIGLNLVGWPLFLLGAGYIALHPTEVKLSLRDWWRLRTYSAPADVRALSEEIHLTKVAQRTFYASYPTVIDKSHFVQHCTFPEQSFVIGCYDGDRIYVLDVQEKDLESVEPVTAAHELLHAVWLRHDAATRKRLSQQLHEVYNQANDPKLRELLDKYRSAGSDSDTLDSELHSILATEVHQLTPELETYYSQYLSNRGKVVDLYDSYEETFAKNQAEVDKRLAMLKDIETDLDTIQIRLTTQKPIIDANNRQLDTYAAAGDAPNYTRLLSTQRALVDEYNREVRRYNALVGQYRQIVDELKALSLRHNELRDAIDATKIQTIKEN